MYKYDKKKDKTYICALNIIKIENEEVIINKIIEQNEKPQSIYPLIFQKKYIT